MYIIDNRQLTKNNDELIHDKRLIRKALTFLFDYKIFIYDYQSSVKHRGKKLTRIAEVQLLDAPSKDTGIEVYKKSFFNWGQPKPLQVQAVAYGDVVYIRVRHDEERSTLYVTARDMLLVKSDYTGTLDLWNFSLHYQQAIKEHKDKEFNLMLMQDNRFFEK